MSIVNIYKYHFSPQLYNNKIDLTTPISAGKMKNYAPWNKYYITHISFYKIPLYKKVRLKNQQK